VGYVGQDTIMFDETIEENLNVGLKERLTDAEVASLMDRVNSGDF